MSPPLAFLTTCSAAQLGAAVALARSFLAQHPGASATVVVADLDQRAPALPDERLVLVAGAGLAGPDFELLVAAYAGEELARAIAPWALEGTARPTLWLSGQAVVLAALSVVEGLGLAVAASEATVVDAGVAAAIDGELLAAWRHRVVAFDEQPLATLLARHETVTLVRDPAWGVDAVNAATRGVNDDGGTLRLEDGTAVAWARIGPGPVPKELLSVLARRDALAADVPAVVGGFKAAADGTPLDDRLRALFRQGVAAGELTAAPFDAAGWTAFRGWLQASDPLPGSGGLSRFVLEVWRSRPDLRVAYGDLRDAGVRDGLLGLLALHWDEWGLPDALRLSPPPPAGAVAAPIGVNVAGYFQSELGVGEAARRVIAALDAAHVPALPVQGSLLPPSRRGTAHASTALVAAPFDVNLVCVNADGLPAFVDNAGPGFFEDRYTIGLWWWELPDFPERFTAAFAHVDEVWVGSQYVLDAIAPTSPVPVLHMPIAVPRPAVTRLTREELGLPEGFLVLTMFDFSSVMGRKNPLGLVEAFRRAFGADADAQLVVKCINAVDHEEEAQALRLAVLDEPNVTLVEDYVSAEVRDAMLATCDCYASLHRSEGFGLTLAEAMALGRPTVATNWSGNLDFMTPETAWLIPCTLVPVGDGHPPYDAGSRWADPDLDAAADALREVRVDPAAAEVRGAAGARAIAEHRSTAVAGAVMRARLEALRPQVEAASASAAARRRARVLADLAGARDRAARGPEEFVVSGARGVVRKVLLRVLRPVIANQRASDDAVLDGVTDSLVRLQDEVAFARRAEARLTAALLAAHRGLESRTRG